MRWLQGPVIPFGESGLSVTLSCYWQGANNGLEMLESKEIPLDVAKILSLITVVLAVMVTFVVRTMLWRYMNEKKEKVQSGQVLSTTGLLILGPYILCTFLIRLAIHGLLGYKFIGIKEFGFLGVLAFHSFIILKHNNLREYSMRKLKSTFNFELNISISCPRRLWFRSRVSPINSQDVKLQLQNGEETSQEPLVISDLKDGFNCKGLAAIW